MAIIELKAASFSYDMMNKRAIDNIDLKIAGSEKIAIIGANGSGKSTLFSLLNSSYLLDEGKYLLEGREISRSKKDRNEVRKKVALVFQNPDDQFIAPTVMEEISFGLFNLGYKKEEVKERLDLIAYDLAIEDLLEKRVTDLSGGQKKIIAIASSLVMDPLIFLLDEPTANLDYKATQSLMAVLKKLEESNKTLVISTHDMDFVWQWADRVIVMERGKIIKDGSREILLDDDFVNYKRPAILDFYDYLKKGKVSLDKMDRSL